MRSCVLTNPTCVAIEVALEAVALLRVDGWRLLLRACLLFRARLLLPQLRSTLRERQLEVALLSALHRAQLARIDHELLACLSRPGQEGEALAIVGCAVEVAAQQDGAVALIVPIPPAAP